MSDTEHSPEGIEWQKRREIKKHAFSETEASEYIGMSRSYLRQARSNGDRPGRTPAPPYVRIGRTIRYRQVDLDTWLESLVVESPKVDLGEPESSGEAA
jgi:predicted DNA-binding transcriptional regulator AlpA